jgi:pyrroline-5-carboxylate reductase
MNIGFIGCGNMGGAIAKAISTKMNTNIYIYDIDKSKSNDFAAKIGANAVERSELLYSSDIVFLGVKPNMILSLVDEIKGEVKEGAVLVSMAAGVKLSSLEAAGEGLSFIRIMPNTPVTLGEGMTAYAKGLNVTEKQVAEFLEIYSACGTLAELDEEKIDAFCAIAGCGPAYAYMFIDALAKVGEKIGLSYNDAMTYAATMLRGSSFMALKTGIDPVTLRKNVCSPGGATIEGVKVLEANGFDSLIGETIEAAFKRTVELGQKK